MSENVPAESESIRPETSAENAIARRSFLAGAGGIAALGAGVTMIPAMLGKAPSALAIPPSPSNPLSRAGIAKRLRQSCADILYNQGLVPHPVNSDEILYPDRIGSFTKGLPHNSFGEVDPASYVSLLSALTAADPYNALEFVPSGQPNSLQRLKLTNPLGGMAYELEGVDPHNTTVPAAPAFASAEIAGEMVENYWMALTRDIPYSQYSTHPTVAQACADLSSMSDFRGPKVGGQVTPQTLFRDAAVGCTVGPFLSQFWWRSQPFGAQYIEPRMRTVVANIDYMTTPQSWLDVQNGVKPTTTLTFDPTLRYMRNGRDLGRWVHMDVLYQAYFQALLHLMAPPDPSNPFTGGGFGCPPNPGNPYLISLMQDGFTTFGGPHYMTMTTEVSTRALKATWYQKWLVHRHLRPEAFAGRVHHKVVNNRPYPIHSDVLNSAAVAAIQSQYGGNAFLPMAFPEGSPVHPSYTAGHATVAGACVTMIKAFFYTDQQLPNPVVPTTDGLGLVPYTGPDASQITVGGELNKLAANVAYGRNVAGVHWRSDGYESLRLGERIAVSLLRDQKLTYLENLNSSWSFKGFDGQTITI
jgi:hypothetical protein